MKSWRFTPGRRAMHTLWAVVAIVAVAGVGVVGAKEKKRERARDHSHAGYIGIYMQDLTDDVRKGLDLKVKSGVLVSGVEDDGPADKAGIDDGDVIVSFNGTKVSTPNELRDLVREVEPGAEAKMEVVQDGKSRTVTLTVGERPEQWGWMGAPGAPEAPAIRRAFAMLGGPRLGIQGHEISDELGSYFNAKEGDGVLVLSVEEESVAAGAGVQPGDIVQKIGDDKVTDIADLRQSVRDFEAGDEFTITVLRHGKSQALKATMDDQSDNELSWVFDMDGHGPHGNFVRPAPMRMHRFMMQDKEDLRKELDELKEELEQLKQKLDSRAD